MIYSDTVRQPISMVSMTGAPPPDPLTNISMNSDKPEPRLRLSSLVTSHHDSCRATRMRMVAYPKIAEDMRQIMWVFTPPPDIDLAEWADIHARTKDGNDYRSGDMSDPWTSFRRRCCTRTKPC